MVWEVTGKVWLIFPGLETMALFWHMPVPTRSETHGMDLRFHLRPTEQ